ncbi:MAG: thiamine diphosphokinase [Porphyromonas sp.]|nr:thiamine diphosphokinase [Porphyromonas sp.]
MRQRLDISSRYLPQAVVVAHGEMVGDAETQRLLEQSEHVVVCDGALERYLELTDRMPDAVVGDGDSVQEELLTKLGLTMVQVAEQETNDLTKSVRYALEQGWRRLSIVGGTGKREDHMLGNFSLLADYHFELGAEVRMSSQYGLFVPFTGELTVDLIRGQQLSFFALEQVPMSVEGVLYPFEGQVFDRLWQATLNEALGGEVRVHAAGRAMIYISNDIKSRE